MGELREYVGCAVTARYMTTHHERDEESGLDYRGARFYDSDIGRFLSLDPLAADYAAWSAYNYVLGNPVVFIDPSGMRPDHWVESENGKISWKENVTSATDVDLQKGDTYLGTSGLGINEGTGQMVLYKSDGTTTEFTSTAVFSDVTVTGKRISKKSLISVEGHAKLLVISLDVKHYIQVIQLP